LAGLILADLVLAGLVLAGLVLAGFVLANLMLAGLVLAGLVLAGFALADLGEGGVGIIMGVDHVVQQTTNKNKLQQQGVSLYHGLHEGVVVSPHPRKRRTPRSGAPPKF